MECIEIQNFRKKYNNDYSNYYDLLKIEKDAKELMNDFYNNEKYRLKKNPNVSIIEIAKIMGFNIYAGKFKDRKVLATIGVSDKLIKKYGGRKVIIISKQITDEKFLYAIAHELSHYIFDYLNEQADYFNAFRSDERQTNEELRINCFANNLLSNNLYRTFL